MYALLLALAFLTAAPFEDYKKAPFQGWAQNDDRGSTRLIYFSKTSDKPWDYSPGQVAIEYGKPIWKDTYAEKFDELTRGNRYRLGQNYWTNLDTRFPLEIGGKRVEPGIYYVVVERTPEDNWSLVLLDPNSMIDPKMDAWHINRKTSPPGIKLPLGWKKVDETASHLAIQFLMDEKDHRKAELEIRFGPHRLAAPVRVLFEGKQVAG